MRKVRIFVAAGSLIGLTAVLLDYTGTCARWLGWLPKAQVVPAVLAGSAVVLGVLLAVTLLVGRVYCSAVCPLGILQDFVRWLARVKGREQPAAAWTRAVRLTVFALFTGGGLLGLHYAWLDPYAIYARAASCLAPAARILGNRIGDWAAAHGQSAGAAAEVVVPSAGFLALALGLAGAVALAGLWRPRFWCNTVCPAGTLLGALAKFAWFRPRIDAAACVTCGMCAKACPAGAIVRAADGAYAFDRTRCTGCFNCSAVCRKEAISWKK